LGSKNQRASKENAVTAHQEVSGAKTSDAVATFRVLHEAGCFVLPNPWDRGSAIYLAHLGFKALATTSAGYAFTRGLPDAVAVLTRDAMLAHLREIVSATTLPVNADYQSGYGITPEEVAANVTMCVQSGVAGLSIEDATGDTRHPLFDRQLAVERIKASRAAIDASGIPVVLTARCESWLVGEKDAQGIALDRLTAFADAGADCLYAPGVRDLKTIEMVVKVLAPKPVNVLVSAPHPDLTVARLADAGVRRISVGSALARVAWGAFMRAARTIAEQGTFDVFASATPFAELNKLFGT
jgi:2-methylisocitrate lyase-like PEP mutase family enzyme